MTIKTMRIVSGILSAVGAAGVIGTSYLAVKEAPKTKEAMSKLGDNPTFWQKAKTFVKGYKWTLAAGTLTIGSNVTSAAMQAKMVASLSASVAGLTAIVNNSEKFKQKAKEVIGTENYNKITKALAKEESKVIPQEVKNEIHGDNILMWQEHLGFFIGTREDVYRTINYIDKKFNSVDMIGEGTWTYELADFVTDAKLKLLHMDQAKPYLSFGWGYDQLYYTKKDKLIYIDQELFDTPQKDDNGNVYYELRFNHRLVYSPEYFEEVMADESELNGYLQETPQEYRDEMREELGYEPRYEATKKRK